MNTFLMASANFIDNGKSDYAIVLGSNPAIVEKTAAEELQKTLEKISGVKLPVVQTDKFKGKAIFIGQTKRSAKELNIDFKTLRPDEIILKKIGDDLFLCGEKRCGTLYAVYELLESYGYRRLTHRDEVVPKQKTLTLKEWNYRYAPPFFNRDRLGGAGGKFGAWLRVNGHYEGIPKEYGGVIKLIGWCHTFDSMVPYKKYLKSNPEYFALWKGKRGLFGQGSGLPQLCLSNPEVRRMLKEKTLEMLRREVNPKIISLSQNDSWGGFKDNYCRCAKCKALDDSEGTPMASILSVVNEVADAVKKEFPDVLIETIAYHYSRKPPKNMVPRGNVVIRFCTANDFLYPWNSEQNAKCRDEFLKWSKVAPKLYVWNYTTNFQNLLMPHPNIQNYAEDLRFMQNNNVVAVLEQGYGKGLIPDLAPVHTYLTAKLMWNPQLDQKKVLDEFLKLYYGAAAPAISEYIKKSRDIFVSKKMKLGGSIERINNLSIAELLSLKAVFNRAEELVKDRPQELLRVKTAALSVNMPVLYSDEAKYENRNTPSGKKLRKQIDLIKLVNECRDTYLKVNEAEHWRENGKPKVDTYINNAEKRVSGNWNKGKHIPEQFKNIKLQDIRVFDTGDLTLWYSKVDKNGVASLDKKQGWKAHLMLDPSMGLAGQIWQVMLGVRTEAKTNANSFSTTSNKFGNRFIPISKIRGEKIKYVDLGTFLFPKEQVYFAVSPSGVNQKLYLRDFVLIRKRELY
jgi:hypothetical protein